MNDDPTKLHPWIEPELEARLAALVLGEASDFERDELERLVAERPELALYRERLETMHRMLREVAIGESAEEQGGWRLAPERREVVLARLGGTVPSSKGERRRSERKGPWSISPRFLAVAASILFLGLLLGLMFPASTGSLRKVRSAGNAAGLFVDSGAIEGMDFPAIETATPDSSTLGVTYANDYLFRGSNASIAPATDEERRALDMAYADRPIRPPAPSSPAPFANEPNEGNASSLRRKFDDREEDRSQRRSEIAGNEVAAAEERMAISRAYADSESSTLAKAESSTETAEARTRLGIDATEAEKGRFLNRRAEIPAARTPERKGHGQVAQIDIEGNARTKDHVIRQELPVEQGLQRYGDFDNGAGAEDKIPYLGDLPVVGALVPGQAGGGAAEAAPAPAPAAAPKPATPASGPVVPGETVVVEQLKKGAFGVDSPGAVDTDTDAGSTVRVGGGFEGRDSRLFGSGGTLGSGGAEQDHLFTRHFLGGSSSLKRFDYRDAGPRGDVDGSVQDILALTPQLNLNTTAGGIAWQATVPEAQTTGTSFPITPQDPTSFESRDLASASSIELVRELPLTDEEGVGVTMAGQRSGAAAPPPNSIDQLIAEATGSFPEVRTKSPPIFGIAGVATDPGIAEMRRQLQSLRKPTPAALGETSPSTEPFSTFSLHVSDVSFQLAKAALASGQWPEADKIRIEEFVNAFDYGDPMPGMGERVAARIDQAAHPFLQQRQLVRIALRTAEAGRSASTPLRLTLLLDTSGSMERPDRRETVRRAVTTLTGLLGEHDRVTLVSFARQPRLVADSVPGNEAAKLAETVAALPSEGGTNLEAALQLAFEKAREHREEGAQNRIVLLTDGAANLGDAKPESLGQRVEMMREAGIAFDAAGIGAEGLNDEILEALTRKGDGRYYLLDRPEDAEEGFAKQIAGAFRPAAKNVKVQVEFDPGRVKSYKLLGFEKHRLATEDFRNDAVDAAELAAAEAGVAVYQVEPDPAGEGDLGSVSVRFRDLESDEMVERRWALPHLASAPAPEQGSDAILLATVASQFAAKLAGGPLGDVVDLGELARLAAALPPSPRVQELRTMIEQARGLESLSVSF